MEIASITSKLEDEQSLVAKLQKQIKELLARIAVSFYHFHFEFLIY